MPRNKENQSAYPKHLTNWIVEDNSSRNFRGGYTWDIKGQKTKISNYFLLLNTRRNFCELDWWEFYFHYWLCRSTAHIEKWAINERKFQRQKFIGSLEWRSWRNSKKRNLAILLFDNWSNQSSEGHYASLKKVSFLLILSSPLTHLPRKIFKAFFIFCRQLARYFPVPPIVLPTVLI